VSCRRVLVVEDDERVCFVLRHTLTRLDRDCEIVTAQNGREALQAIEEAAFDLMIADLVMPGMGGVDLTESVRALSPSPIVIWVTAHGCRQHEAEAQRLGCIAARTSRWRCV